MTTNKPDVFEVYRTKQGTLENVVLLADYEALQAECEKLREDAELQELLKDKSRLDWLADVNNNIGNVLLPRDIVERNLGSLRDGIDEAMRIEQ